MTGSSDNMDVLLNKTGLGFPQLVERGKKITSWRESFAGLSGPSGYLSMFHKSDDEG